MPVPAPPDMTLLCTVRAILAQGITLAGAPGGERRINEVESLVCEGERLAGRLEGRAAADWMSIPTGAGFAAIDARWTLRTHDGALVYVQYLGRIALAGPAAPTLYVAPRFETGDPRYAWLNGIQAIGRGTFDVDRREVVYGFWELR
jgi:hypothetical protein